MKTDFFTKEELIQTWNEANKASKEAEEQIKICKKALVDMDVPVETEIVDGLFVHAQSRRNMSVPIEVAQKVMADTWMDYVVVDKKKFDDELEKRLEDETMTELQAATIRNDYVVDSTSVSYILKAKK